jgi:hypothetical protein
MVILESYESRFRQVFLSDPPETDREIRHNLTDESGLNIRQKILIYPYRYPLIRKSMTR